MKFRVSLHSDVGDREKNEDFAGYRIKPWSFAVFAVADGLGGHDAGEVASSTAVNSLIYHFSKKPSLKREAIQETISSANAAVFAAQDMEHSFYSMKTTLSAVLYRRGKIVLTHVGDSRIYLFRKGRLIYQTRDHSLAQMQVLQGKASEEEIRGHIDRNQLLRALGSVTAKPDISDCIRIRRGDAILLCTDGFWENVHESEMEEALRTASDPHRWLSCLLQKHAINRMERQDNFTALAVFAG